MSIRVKIPSQLRSLAGGQPELNIEGASTLKELLEKIRGDSPELIERILDEDAEIRRFINVYVGDEDVRFLQGLETQVSDSQVVAILPAVAGG